MTGSEYWLQREKEWIAARNRKTDKLSEDLENAFLRASDDLQKEIAAWVEKYADAEEITLADARKRLSTGELQRLKLNLEEFTKLAKDNADGRWEKELTSASASVHVTRLQALELQMKNIVRKLYAGQESAMSDFLTGLYADEREHMTYEIQRAKGKFDSLAALPEDRVQKILQRPWADDGQAFSERLWGTQNKLINVMQSELLRGIISGKDTGTIGKSVAKRMGAASYAGVRLIQTETTRLIVESDKDTFEEMGIEQLEIIGTLDRNTCDSCGSLEGRVMKRTEAKAGSTAPPFHPNCRCIIVPYDDFLSGDGQRTARDPENGKTVAIPDISYKDWKAVYVDKTKTLEEWKKAHTKKPESPPTVEKPAFVPAKTIEEAQEYAEQFIDKDGGSFSPFKGVANYKGISLDMANSVNEALTDVFSTLNIPKLRGIKVVSSKTVQGKKAFPDGENAVASYNMAGQGVFLNKDVLKNAKAFDGYRKRADEAWDLVMKNIDSLNASGKALAEKYKEAGRSLVAGDTVQGLVTHELGHHVQWQVLKAKEFNELTARRGQYAGKISGYATASSGEYIAESFAAYMKGERSILDPDFVKAMDKLLKKPRQNAIIKETGALNDKNDPEMERRDAHAERYYEFIRKSNKENWISRVSKNSGMRKASVEKIYEHVFIDKHKLLMGYMRFPADYAMAESFQRLFEGNTVYHHDLIMLRHERLELELIRRYGYSFSEAHEITERKYNYSKALKEWEKNRNAES